MAVEAPKPDQPDPAAQLVNMAVTGIATNFAVNLMMEFQSEDKEDEEE
jgi:hypothetical protein